MTIKKYGEGAVAKPDPDDQSSLRREAMAESDHAFQSREEDLLCKVCGKGSESPKHRE